MTSKFGPILVIIILVITMVLWFTVINISNDGSLPANPQPHQTTVYLRGYEPIMVDTVDLVGVESITVRNDSIWADGVLVDTNKIGVE
jgi:hypothetical protein